MSNFLKGLTLQNYRGIGPKPAIMAPFKQFNFFIGANNSGKSAILNFINAHTPVRLNPRFAPNPVKPIDPVEPYGRGSHGPIGMAIGIPADELRQSSYKKIPSEYNWTQIQALLDIAIKCVTEDDVVWFRSNLPYGEELIIGDGPDIKRCLQLMEAQRWNFLWQVLTRSSGGSIQDWVRGVFEVLRKTIVLDTPQVTLIPAVRQISVAQQDDNEYSGRGLINRLAEIQNPEAANQSERLLFDKINLFLQDLTGRDEARIEIPHSRQNISVHMNGQVLPLSSLGTGIHEVIILASYCTFTSQSIMCIEEPEIHLHPILQRKLIRYLQKNTGNQYFIATHSPTFIDTPGAAIFHVTHDGIQTHVRESLLRSERYSICVDLGHRASDIVQSNAVLWVEGPSERTYLKHWLRAYNEDLIEGVHYSIMFYGGRLLSHLSADDSEVQAFIDLRYLNQNLAVIMDSDKSDEDSSINDTKLRIFNEFKGKTGIAWLTAGREIENYVRYDLLQEGLKEIHPDLYHDKDKDGRFEHAFYFRTREKRPQEGAPPTFVYKKADKVKLSKWICQRPAELDVLDLKERIAEIAGMIERAND